MLRWLLLIVLVGLLWRRRNRAPESPREQWLDPAEAGATADGQPVREMVADPVCGAFVAMQSALTTTGGGSTWFFCSSGCYRSFLFENRRAAGQ